MHVAVAGRKGPDETDGRLAVERTAALLEERRLLDEVRVAIQLEQSALDLRDGRRPRHSVELLGEHRIVLVEVVQIVRRQYAELVEQAAAEAHLLCELVAV